MGALQTSLWTASKQQVIGAAPAHTPLQVITHGAAGQRNPPSPSMPTWAGMLSAAGKGTPDRSRPSYPGWARTRQSLALLRVINQASTASPCRRWYVDLEGTYEVHEVVIVNRCDCCAGKLKALVACNLAFVPACHCSVSATSGSVRMPALLLDCLCASCLLGRGGDDTTTLASADRLPTNPRASMCACSSHCWVAFPPLPARHPTSADRLKDIEIHVANTDPFVTDGARNNRTLCTYQPGVAPVSALPRGEAWVGDASPWADTMGFAAPALWAHYHERADHGLAGVQNTCAHGGKVTFSCSAPVVGRYVSVQVSGKGVCSAKWSGKLRH